MSSVATLASQENKFRPLSGEQERKLVDYLDEHLADIRRNYTKRSVVNSFKSRIQ